MCCGFRPISFEELLPDVCRSSEDHTEDQKLSSIQEEVRKFHE